MFYFLSYPIFTCFWRFHVGYFSSASSRQRTTAVAGARPFRREFVLRGTEQSFSTTHRGGPHLRVNPLWFWRLDRDLIRNQPTIPSHPEPSPPSPLSLFWHERPEIGEGVYREKTGLKPQSPESEVNRLVVPVERQIPMNIWIPHEAKGLPIASV